jgi:hypothetical protein
MTQPLMRKTEARDNVAEDLCVFSIRRDGFDATCAVLEDSRYDKDGTTLDCYADINGALARLD